MHITSALRAVAACALVALATACAGDLPSAPEAASLDVGTPSFAKGGNGKGDVVTGAASEGQTVTINIDTRVSRLYDIGNQSWVYIPAGALCDDNAGYGPALWDTACTPAQGVVDIAVTVRDLNGRPSAEFHKDVRFVPASNSDWRQWVILGLKVKGNLNHQLGYGILYRPTGENKWIDESLTDPSLAAWRAMGNVVARRLKHFSGYNVALGFDEQSDPTLTAEVY